MRYLCSLQVDTAYANAQNRTPRHSGWLSPVVHAVLAYQTALKRGTNVDKPRNLAKAVTVE